MYVVHRTLRIDHPVEGVIDAAFDKYLPLPKEWQHNPDTGDGGVHQHDKYDAEQDPAKKGNSGEAPPAAAAAALPAGGQRQVKEEGLDIEKRRGHRLIFSNIYSNIYFYISYQRKNTLTAVYRIFLTNNICVCN